MLMTHPTVPEAQRSTMLHNQAKHMTQAATPGSIMPASAAAFDSMIPRNFLYALILSAVIYWQWVLAMGTCNVNYDLLPSSCTRHLNTKS